MSSVNNDPTRNYVPPPPPPGSNKAKLHIAEDQDLYGGWGLFEVKDLNAFYGLGFAVDSIEIQGQKVTGSHMFLVEELPHITLSDINSAIARGVIVQSHVEL